MVKKRGKRKGRSAAFMRSINPFLKRKRASKRGSNMVRKSKRGRSRGRSSSSGKVGFIAPLAYGALRQPVANAITPAIASVGFIPANLADEAGMGVLSWVAMRYGNGMVREIGKAGLIIEIARLSEGFLAGRMPNTSVPSGNVF